MLAELSLTEGLRAPIGTIMPPVRDWLEQVADDLVSGAESDRWITE